MENLLSRTEMALLNKTWGNGLQSYTQSNCQCTLTDQGMRIYRPPNLTYPDCGNTIWGGLRIHPFELSDNILVKDDTTKDNVNTDSSTESSSETKNN